ncbi:uncharacterized protein LOC116165329 [Photinus pyralis]|uniref:uncharacterized protein LOC116165329 n=1 Tax=Photinus pyralis TaxID=7054 RepID=UPI00126728DB|nr:uncharacterized protein LOC116165329 [Photinus pyralis]
MEQKELSLSKNWITLNIYTCVELNAHGLLILIERHRQTPELICPWLYSSQPNHVKSFLDKLDQWASTYSTVINFDLLDLLQRRHRIQTINSIISDTNDKFIFPRERSIRLGTDQFPNSEKSTPLTEELFAAIEEAKEKVFEDCYNLEIPPSQENVHPTDYSEADNNFSETSEVDVNVEDRDDIDEERGIFEEPEDLGDLNIQDFSAKYNKSNQTLPRNMLKIKVNGKEVVVKKSTLCWLFSIKTNRLSSDRLLRFRGSTASSSLNKKKQTKSTSTKRKKKRIAISEAETDEESDRYSEKSELENESFGEEDATDDTTPINTKIDISAENYYAVCYLRSWYIGRVLEIFNDDTCQIKFLKCVLDSYV